MNSPRLLALAVLSAASIAVFAAAPFAEAATSTDGTWSEVSTPAPAGAARSQAGRAFMVRLDRLREQLDQAPSESRGLAAGAEIQLPLADGSFVLLRAVTCPVLGEVFQRRHPEIQTFLAVGVDDPRIGARLELTPFGARAIVFTPRGTAVIDPLEAGRTDAVVSRWLGDEERASFECDVSERFPAASAPGGPATSAWGSQLRTLRFVLVATGEFTQALGGIPATTARLATVVNRISGYFERDAAVRLEAVQLVAFPDPATDPFDYVGLGQLADRNTVVIDSLFGSESYDMGGIVTTQSGTTRGTGYRPTLCSLDGVKAGSVLATHNPGGIDVELGLGHELGHGLGATHTQDRSCNRSSETPYEVGSGLTILSSMPAACPVDVQPQRDPYYHMASIEQFITTLGANPDCGTTTATGNTPPTADAGPDVTIPRGTPFVLRGVASDADAGDALTFTWEQFDKAPTSGDPILGPVFRWRPPTADPVRFCPPAGSVLSGVPETYEPLVNVDRTLHFRLLARDNHAGTGGVAWDEKIITVSGAPFAVTSPNGGNTVPSSAPFPVTWTVGGGSVAPNVNILLSTDGGAGWVPLLMSTANDGAEMVSYATPFTLAACRIKVEAAGNIFYDVSNANFTLEGSPTPVLVSQLEAERTGEGVAVRWRFGNPAQFAGVVVERSEGGGQSWTAPPGERLEEDGASVFLDRTARPDREYDYRLIASLPGGGSMTFGPITAPRSAGTDALAIVSLAPNPSSGALRIEYTIPRSAPARLEVLDLQGRVIAVLADGVHRAGRHQALWNGEGRRGRVPGLYYVRVTSENGRRARAAILVE